MNVKTPVTQLLRKVGPLAAAACVASAGLSALGGQAAAVPGPGGCLRTGDRIRFETPEAFVVYTSEGARRREFGRERFAVWGCLKKRERRVRLDQRPHFNDLVVYRPAGRFVATLAEDQCYEIGCGKPIWLTMVDLKKRALYRVHTGATVGGYGSIGWIGVRRTGSLAYLVVLGFDRYQLIACEMPTCYSAARAASRKVVLDEGEIDYDSVELQGPIVRWTRDGQLRSAKLR